MAAWTSRCPHCGGTTSARTSPTSWWRWRWWARGCGPSPRSTGWPSTGPTGSPTAPPTPPTPGSSAGYTGNTQILQYHFHLWDEDNGQPQRSLSVMKSYIHLHPKLWIIIEICSLASLFYLDSRTRLNILVCLASMCCPQHVCRLTVIQKCPEWTLPRTPPLRHSAAALIRTQSPAWANQWHTANCWDEQIFWILQEVYTFSIKH